MPDSIGFVGEAKRAVLRFAPERGSSKSHLGHGMILGLWWVLSR